MLRPGGHEASCSHGHTRSPDGPAVTLAERACGETDRLDPPGMPRSHRRLRRSPSAPDPCRLRRLLQQTPNASVPGEGFAAPSCNGSASSLLSPSWAGFTININIAGCSFRQAQLAWAMDQARRTPATKRCSRVSMRSPCSCLPRRSGRGEATTSAGRTAIAGLQRS